MDGASAWTTVGELPVAVPGIRGVSLDNKILMTGGIIIHNMINNNSDNAGGGIYDEGYIEFDFVLQFNSDEYKKSFKL